jgi:GTP cyclohydrolase I
LTTEIGSCIQETLQPLGVAVVIEAKHLCMQMRGIQSKILLPPHQHLQASLKMNVRRIEFINLITAKLL